MLNEGRPAEQALFPGGNGLERAVTSLLAAAPSMRCSVARSGKVAAAGSLLHPGIEGMSRPSSLADIPSLVSGAESRLSPTAIAASEAGPLLHPHEDGTA